VIIHLGRTKIRSAIAALAAGALTVAGAVAVLATTAEPAFAASEDDGASCAVSLPGSLTSNAMLPDPFTKIDGTRITTTSDWRCRREEIKKLAEQYVYGSKPGKPTVSGTVSSSNITVNVSANGKNASFSASVSLPSGTGPFPAVIVVGGLGADTTTIKNTGVAVINYDPLAVGAEGTSRTAKSGAFYTLYGSNSSTGLLMAWAWGVSRIIDVIEQSGGTVLKADSLGVTGCSRYGKGTFVIGAFDQRIALTMPIESGSGGVPIFRGIPGESGAQPLSSAYSEQPWLGDAFSQFTSNPNQLPIDTHEIVGMIAPRGLFIMDNPGVDWLAARSGSVGALGGAEVYRALGAINNITYWSNVSNTTHCAIRSEWTPTLQQYLRAFLLKNATSTGQFQIASSKAGNLSQWRSWTTPTLNGGTTPPNTTTPPVTTTPPRTTTPPVTTTPPTTTTPPQPGGCSATYRVVNSWQGGFQSEVAVANNGSSTINGWTVKMTLASGVTIVNIWNGVNTGTSGAISVKNAPYNGTIGASGSTTFGFVANGNTSSVSNVSCTTP
jgi:hypothetical protein